MRDPHFAKGDHCDELLRRVIAAVGTITCNVRGDNGNVAIDWYDFGNVYGCHRSAEGGTLIEALESALTEIETSRRKP